MDRGEFSRTLHPVLQRRSAPKRLQTFAAPKKYCTDNGAMVAGLGWHYWKNGLTDDLELDAKARLPLETPLPFRFS